MHPQTFFTRLDPSELDDLDISQIKEKKRKNWYADMNRDSVTFIPPPKLMPG